MPSALDIFPYTNNKSAREHHFTAFGVTLMTENRFGKLVYYNGNANIQITEPAPGIMIEVPYCVRTSRMRDQMFHMGKFAPCKPTKSDNCYRETTTTATGNNITWHNMTQKQLKAVLDKVSASPLTKGEEVRTYMIWDRSDRSIKVRPGFDRNSDEKVPLDQLNDRLGQIEEDKDINMCNADLTNSDQAGHTKLGYDPPPPD